MKGKVVVVKTSTRETKWIRDMSIADAMLRAGSIETLVLDEETYRMGWMSLSQYARYVRQGHEGLSTPAHVVAACKELLATT